MKLVIGGVLCLGIVLLLAVVFMKIWLPAKMIRELENYQNKLLERQFQEIDNTYHEMRGWRHDYKNHMQVLQIYVENKEWEQAKAYISQMNDELGKVDHVIKTGNIMADAIVNSKVSLAKTRKIELDVTAKIPKTLPVSDV